jgi:hypothetical protein
VAESAAPFVECEQVHAGLAVNDITTALEFHTKKLGFAAAFTWGDPPTFAGVKLDKARMFLRKGTPDPKGCFVSFMVGDADALYEFCRSQGVEVVEPIDDRPYGIRDHGGARPAWVPSIVRASLVQLWPTHQSRASGRSCASGEAPCRSFRGLGRASA